MFVKRVIEGVHVVPMGIANAFLIEGDDGLTLIDAGYPGKEAAVFEAIRGLGCSPNQLKHLFSLTATLIISGAPLRSCSKPVRGPTCTCSISLWPKVGSFSANEGGTWSVAASAVHAALPSRRAPGA
jgi:hypothetical protein